MHQRKRAVVFYILASVSYFVCFCCTRTCSSAKNTDDDWERQQTFGGVNDVEEVLPLPPLTEGISVRRGLIDSCPDYCTLKKWLSLSASKRMNCKKQCNLKSKKYQAQTRLQNKNRRLRDMPTDHVDDFDAWEYRVDVSRKKGLLRQNDGKKLKKVVQFTVPCNVRRMWVNQDGSFHWKMERETGVFSLVEQWKTYRPMLGCQKFHYLAVEEKTNLVYFGEVIIDTVKERLDFCRECCLSDQTDTCQIPAWLFDVFPDSAAIGKQYCNQYKNVCPAECMEDATTWNSTLCYMLPHYELRDGKTYYDTCVPKCPFQEQQELPCPSRDVDCWYPAGFSAGEHPDEEYGDNSGVYMSSKKCILGAAVLSVVKCKNFDQGARYVSPWQKCSNIQKKKT